MRDFWGMGVGEGVTTPELDTIIGRKMETMPGMSHSYFLRH